MPKKSRRIELLTREQIASSVHRILRYDVFSPKSRTNVLPQTACLMYMEAQSIVNRDPYANTRRHFPRMFPHERYSYLLAEVETKIIERLVLIDIQKQLVLKFLLYMKQYKQAVDGVITKQLSVLKDAENIDDYLDRMTELGNDVITASDDQDILNTIISKIVE